MHAPVKAGGLLSASEGPVRQRALRLYQRRFKINPPLSPAPATPGLLRAPFEGSPLAPRPQEPTGKVDSHGRTAVSRRTGGCGVPAASGALGKGLPEPALPRSLPGSQDQGWEESPGILQANPRFQACLASAPPFPCSLIPKPLTGLHGQHPTDPLCQSLQGTLRAHLTLAPDPRGALRSRYWGNHWRRGGAAA